MSKCTAKKSSGILLLLLSLLLFLTSTVVPQTVSDSDSPSPLPSCRKIHSAFRLPNGAGTYLVSKRNFVQYSFEHQAEKRQGRLRDLGFQFTRVQAAFVSHENDLIAMKGCRYHRYTASDGLPLQLTETRNLTDIGLPCNVHAALRLAGDTLAFKGCQVWKLNPSTNVFQRDGRVTALGLPCRLDAALEWDPDGVALFIKGHNYWRLEAGETRVAGPFHTDDLNICSWYLCGEADWMAEPPSSDGAWACNGDSRLCSLRLDQVTLSGLHNAGAGFNGGWNIILDCFLRNHGLNITRQMENGIRHLDIDPCHEGCGLVGTCHAGFCGGSICMMIKQMRHFLQTHRHDVITVNFNHEILEPALVFPELTRHLKTQLKPMLSTYSREHEGWWPTLNHSVSTNQRVFVFYAPMIRRQEYAVLYDTHPWIHSEGLIGSTWRPFQAWSSCQGIVNLTATRCDVRQYRSLVEVAIVPEPLNCVSNLASTCRPHLHQSLKACQNYRFRQGKSPNVLLVDYPEVDMDHGRSVFHAVFFQNVRNIATHRSTDCQVRVDAVVSLSPQSSQSLFFVGEKIISYDRSIGVQSAVREAPDHLKNIDAAYMSSRDGFFYVVKGCQHTEINASSLQPVTSSTRNVSPCAPITHAAVRYQNDVYLFQGCQMHLLDSTFTTQSPLELERNLCDLDAVMTSQDGSELYMIKGRHYYVKNNIGLLNAPVNTHEVLDLNIDLVICQTAQQQRPC